MTTAAPSTALATIQPAFTDPERLALAGFLAGYRGLTRDAYALDLRQFTTWCRTRSVNLFAVRRADIEGTLRVHVCRTNPCPAETTICSNNYRAGDSSADAACVSSSTALVPRVLCGGC